MRGTAEPWNAAIMNPSHHDIVVIGGSAGAPMALETLLPQLDPQLPAAVFVVLHLQAGAEEWLSNRLSDYTALAVRAPQDKEPIQSGTVYVASPDKHLIVKNGYVRVVRGPRENLWRPAIDVLFRSAAVAYGTRVVATLLSGNLDDGTAGLHAIKVCGGITLVQDPTDAPYPEMPSIAAANVEVDYSLPSTELGGTLNRLVREPALPALPVPFNLRSEVAIAEGDLDLNTTQHHSEPPSALSCPECAGPLWHEEANSFRCLVGHAFGSHSLLKGVEEALDRTLWAGIRLFEQRVHITKRMAEQEQAKGRKKRAEQYLSRAAEAEQHVRNLKRLHMSLASESEPVKNQDVA